MYTKRMVERYGQEEVDKIMNMQANRITKWSDQEYLDKIEHYKKINKMEGAAIE